MQDPNEETQRIAGQLQSIYYGPSWVGPSLKALLTGVDATAASTRIGSGVHTIWELVLHITAWLRIARERLTAAGKRDPDAAENWPTLSGDWNKALEDLEAEVTELERAILHFPADRLDAMAPARDAQTFYVLLHGVIQHTAYHAGQIALLKKR